MAADLRQHLRTLDLIQDEHDHQPKFFKANHDLHAPRLLETAQVLRAELDRHGARATRFRDAWKRAMDRERAEKARRVQAEAELDRTRAELAAALALLPADPAEDINASWLPPRYLRAALEGGCTDCGGKTRYHPGHYPTCPAAAPSATT